MKRTFAVLLTVLLIILPMSVFPATASATASLDSLTPATLALNSLEAEFLADAATQLEEDVIKQFVGAYRGDAVFEQHYEYDPSDAIAMVTRVVNGALRQFATIRPMALEPWAGLAYANNVPAYTQSTTYTCGTASALQVIYSRGGASNVSGSTMTAKEATLNNVYPIHAQKETIVWQVRDLINTYTSANSYTYYPCANLTQSQFFSLVFTSLCNDYPPILHAKTGYLSYYGGVNTGHYITVTAASSQTNQITVNDCHYNSSYNGQHTVSVASAYNSVHTETGRYLIYQNGIG